VDAVSVDVTVIELNVRAFPESVDVFRFVNINVDAVTFVPLTALETILLPVIVENNMFPLIVEHDVIGIVMVFP
jgi:hypothetical protein